MKRITIPVSILIGMLICFSFSDAADKEKIIAKDSQYVSYENGIVYDEKTNIEWLAGPDKFVTWDEAKAFESVRKQAELGASVVCSGHGPVIRDANGKYPV